MFFRILKKDLKRKKAMNAVMLSFILLATMFVASGISNVVSVTNGIDSYLDKAGIGDYVVIHELAHRRYMDHSKEFWAEVEKYCPDYRERRQQLKKYKLV